MWIASRILAGLTTAVLTGIAVGVIALTLPFVGQPVSRTGEYLGDLFTCAVVALLIGGIPGALVMLFSRARVHPWRAVPIALIGTTIGFFAGFETVTHVPNAMNYALFYPLVVGLTATAGGLLMIRLFVRPSTGSG